MMTRTSVVPPSQASSRMRSILTWAGIVVGVTVLALLLVRVFDREESPRRPFDPTSVAPEGTLALVTIAEDHLGLDIRVVGSATEAASAAEDGVLVVGRTNALSDDDLDALVATAGRVIFLEAIDRDLTRYFGGAMIGFHDGSSLDPACDFAAAQHAGSIAPGLLFQTPGSGTTRCYPSGDAAGLLVAHRSSTELIALDARAIATNEALTGDGHAALALGLLAPSDGGRVAWYLPEASILPGADGSLQALTPPWVTPTLVLGLITLSAAMLWRGRRFGPLVAERLPVTVRAGETVAGRARLYARAHDPAHEAVRLRGGTTRRLAAILHVSTASTPETVAAAVAARTGIPIAQTLDVLTRDVTTSQDLRRIAADLRDLEGAARTPSNREDRS